MALIHEKLYQAKDLAKIDLASYLRSLISYLFRSYSVHEAIHWRTHTDNIYLRIDTAMPCGLIINELVSNALKHAFPAGCGGEISVECKNVGANRYLLSVRDTGVGLPTDLDFEHTSTLGLQLVTTLVKQLDGVIELQRNGGTEIKIWFAEVA
jgi:two-component sensor histidine kinase